MAKAIEKGATYLDKLCHKFYDEPKGHGERTGYVCRLCGGPLETQYCEERLYLVKCADCGTLALVKTVNPEVSASITLARPILTPQNEWVSVEERLPEFPGFLDHTMVVTCDKNGHVMPMVRERTLVGYEWMERWLFPWHEIYVGPEITYWMSLPESPKEDK